VYPGHDRSCRDRGPARRGACCHRQEIANVEVCGQGDCNVLVPGNGLKQRDLLALTEVVGPADPPAVPSGWFRVRVTMEHHGVDENYGTSAWVPSAGLLRARDETGKGYAWFTVPRDTALSFLKVTRKLDPLPAATLRGLNAKLPPPRVDRVVTAPGPPARCDGVPWGWIALAVGLAGLTVTRLRRRVPRLLRLARAELPGRRP
jgi:hypothetical protein